MSRGRAPALIVIPDPAFAPGRTLEGIAAAALAGGADAIQLRAKGIADPDLLAQGRLLAALAAATGATLYLNDRPDLAAACGAGGAHVGPGDAAPETARAALGPDAALGVSVYDAGDLARAEAAGAAYVAIGAVFPTTTKRIAVVGLAGLRRWRARTRLPIIAIGVVSEANAGAAIDAGADGVAVISAVSAAPAPAAATRALAAAVREALARRTRSGDTRPEERLSAEE